VQEDAGIEPRTVATSRLKQCNWLEISVPNVNIHQSFLCFVRVSLSLANCMATYLFQATCLLYLPLSLCLSLKVRRPFLQDSVSLPQSRQSAKLFSSRRNLGLPQPLTRRRVCPPPTLVPGGGAHSLAREGVGNSQFRRGTYTVVLCIYVYFLISPFS
jgi:hypothetical protein